MAQPAGPCPKCGKSMTPGFLLDFTEGVRRVPARWVEGTPEAAPMTGTKTGSHDMRRVDANRCDSCGFLEFYARVQLPGGLFP